MTREVEEFFTRTEEIDRGNSVAPIEGLIGEIFKKIQITEAMGASPIAEEKIRADQAEK